MRSFVIVQVYCNWIPNALKHDRFLEFVLNSTSQATFLYSVGNVLTCAFS